MQQVIKQALADIEQVSDLLENISQNSGIIAVFSSFYTADELLDLSVIKFFCEYAVNYPGAVIHLFYRCLRMPAHFNLRRPYVQVVSEPGSTSTGLIISLQQPESPI
ncbi:MAG: hypothetical protein BWY83_03004 [bacterium ADurb.Bin478]|nr:MAG: hypothetical protein BWY83_03004 [bacterium ADurb.Bin478]